MSNLFSNARATTASKDVQVVDPPPDSISSLSFSPAGDFLAVSSWDNNVRVYAFEMNGQSEGKAMYNHQAPVLDICWNKAGTQVISGGADNAARLFDIQTGQSRQVAAHDAAIKCVKAVETPQGSILATGSWDKTLKYWDLRSSQPIATVQLPERCYSMDVAYPLLVAATANRHVEIFNLAEPTKVFKSQESALRWQTRVVSCFPSTDGFALGSIEARIAIEYTNPKDSDKKYTFRCHRKEVTKTESLVHAVNGIVFHPVRQSVFATCGSDGLVNFWDRDARTRLTMLGQQEGPISSIAFDRTGQIFAYAVSYDWHKGHSGMVPGMPNKIMLHPVTQEDIQKKRS